MGRVIRARRSGPSVVPGEVFDAQHEARRILAEAHSQADLLRAAAVAEGRQAGQVQAAKQLFDVARLRGETVRKAEEQAMQAVLLVAAELLGETLRAEPERISALLEPHLTRVRRAESLVLRLHPDDAHWLSENGASLRAYVGVECAIELRADADIARGGCLIESNLGELDARIETRLTELARALGLEEASP
jgi:flagellar assembly protein FliH